MSVPPLFPRGLFRRHCLGLIAVTALAFLLPPATAENPAEIPIDGDFLTCGLQASMNLVRAGQKIGPWSVDMGNVGLHVGEYAVPSGVGHVVDLNGTRSGSMYQTIPVTRGTRYTVSFLMSGDWTTNPELPRGLSLRFGSARVQFSMVRPRNWSKQNMQWQLMTAEFVAVFPSTGLRFSSDSAGMTDGPLISHVTVLGPPVLPGPLENVQVPLPSDIDAFVRDRETAIALGKALFWDMQAGSDGRTACATCHWHAGADIRTVNTLNPGVPGSTFGHQTSSGPELAAAAASKFPGPNRTMQPADYPFHRLHEPTLPADDPDAASPENPVTRDTMEVTGSQGVMARKFDWIVEGSAEDAGSYVHDSLFHLGTSNLRQVTGRNAPTSINAIFFDRSFWDGRANHYFNGVNPFGDLDPSARVLRAVAGGHFDEVRIRLNNAALASQAVGPPNSDVEMAWNGRHFAELARKLFSLRPLAAQQVAEDDSVLGSYRHPSGHGLDTATAGYALLVRKAFLPEWWSATQITSDGYTQMEANFSLFWGLSVMLYESTLVSNESPYDRFARGETTALSPAAKEGLQTFMDHCSMCHSGPEFAGATVRELRSGSSPRLVELMAMAQGVAVYDKGFYNIGVRRTPEDIAVGASHPSFGPLSYARQEQLGGDPDPHSQVSPGERIAVFGAFKAPTLRNVELTGPYMHNGGMKSLTEVVQFYTRGADFKHANIHDLDPDVNGISDLQGNPAKIAEVVEFLKHLTDPRVRLQQAPFDHPELVLPNGHSEVDGKVPDATFVLPANGRHGGAPLGSFEEALQSGLLVPGSMEHTADAPQTMPPAEVPPGTPPVIEPAILVPPAAEPSTVELPVAELPVVEPPAVDPPAVELPVVEPPVVGPAEQ
ncbi:MAG: cytochrome c peroxidase [Planctomycetota bacterium]